MVDVNEVPVWYGMGYDDIYREVGYLTLEVSGEELRRDIEETIQRVMWDKLMELELQNDINT